MSDLDSFSNVVLGDINIARDDYCQPTILRLLRLLLIKNYKLIII